MIIIKKKRKKKNRINKVKANIQRMKAIFGLFRGKEKERNASVLQLLEIIIPGCIALCHSTSYDVM